MGCSVSAHALIKKRESFKVPKDPDPKPETRPRKPAVRPKVVTVDDLTPTSSLRAVQKAMKKSEDLGAMSLIGSHFYNYHFLF